MPSPSTIFDVPLNEKIIDYAQTIIDNFDNAVRKRVVGTTE